MPPFDSLALVKVTACPACGEAASDKTVRRADGAVLRACPRCASWYLRERPQDLSQLYTEGYFRASDSGLGYGTGYTPIQEQLWQWGWLTFTRAVLECAPGPILDVGCAHGQFLALLRALTPDDSRIGGVELAAGAAAIARQRGLAVACTDIVAFAPSGRCQAVTAWDLIEHLAAPADFVARVATWLAPDGLFCFSTPDGQAAHHLPAPDAWPGFGHSYEHVSYFSRAGLTALLAPHFAWSVVVPFRLYGGDFLLGVAGRETPTPTALAFIEAALTDPPALHEAVRIGMVSPRGAAGLVALEMMLGDIDLAAALVPTLEGDLMPGLGALLRGSVSARLGDGEVARRAYEVALKQPALNEVAAASLIALLASEVTQAREVAEAVARARDEAAAACLAAEQQVIAHAQHLAFLEGELQAIYTGLSWRTLARLRGLKDRMLPHQSPARRAYDLGLKGAKVWLDEGSSALAFKARRKLRMKHQTSDPVRRQHQQALAQILATYPGREPWVFLPTIDWGWMMQRPQQLARALANTEQLVFYVTAQMRGDEVTGFRELGKGLYLVSDISLLHDLHRPIVVAQNLDHIASLADFQRPRIVYDYLDALAVTCAGPPSAAKVTAHQAMLAGAAVVTATASQLVTEAAHTRPDVLSLPNAADPAHFAPNPRRPVPESLAKIRSGDRPVIGYYGALAAWFDYGLVAAVAALRPGYDFILVGPDYDGSLARWQPPSNVHVLGLVPYDALPAYLQAFDVAMIPFVIDAITRATSPVKLFEYMAGGKPIVATPLDEAARYASVRVASGAAAFATALDGALKRRDDPAERALLAREAAENTWAQRAQALCRAVTGQIHSRRPTMVILAAVPIDDSGGGQRPAQLALELLARGWRVVYVQRYQKQENRDLGLVILHPHLETCNLADFDPARDLTPAAAYRPLTVLLELPHPEFVPVVATLRRLGARVIYDLIDDWQTSLGGSWYRARTDDQLLAASDVLVASAVTLQEELAARTGRPVSLVCNAVNTRLFDRHLIPTSSSGARPNLIYIGALWGEWFDWDLVKYVAEAFPHGVVTLIGDYAGQCPFVPLPNMNFLGLVAHTELPAHLARADVALIPFVPSRLTQAVSPLKVFEYLAMGKPVVATPLAELTGLPHVRLAADRHAFVAAIAEALNEPVDEEAIAAFIAENSWAQRVDALLALFRAGTK